MNSAVNYEEHLTLRCSIDLSPMGAVHLSPPGSRHQHWGSVGKRAEGVIRAATKQCPDSLCDIGFLSHRSIIKYAKAGMSF